MREVHIFADGYFIALIDSFDAKDNYRYTFSHLGMSANTKRPENDFSWRPGQADQNQVWFCSLRSFDRVGFISGDRYAIAISRQQRFDTIASLMDILHHQDNRLRLVSTRDRNSVLAHLRLNQRHGFAVLPG